MFDLEELEATAVGTLLLFKCVINRLAPGRAFILPHLRNEILYATHISEGMQSQVKYTMGFYFLGQFTHITA
jgi:hypothetical protein